MIQFTPNEAANLPEGCLADHLDARRRFYLPNALAVSERDGNPDFRLVRYGGDLATVSGGFLSAEFELRREGLDALSSAAPELSWAPVTFESAAVRLLVRSRTMDQGLQQGESHPAVLSGNRYLRLAVHLAPTDTRLLASLLSQGAESVELELGLSYRGLVPGIPGFAVVDSANFFERLRPFVVGRDLLLDDIVAAFLSLPKEGFVTYRPLDASNASLPTDDALMSELARRSLDRFFHRQESGNASAPLYRLIEEEQPEGSCTIGLHTARMEPAEHRLTWSVSALHDALTDTEARAVHFPVVGEVSPFSDRRISVTNSLPFDPAFLRRVVVDVRYTGPSGTFEHATYRFPDDGDFQEIRTRYPAVNTEFGLESRIRLLLMPPGGSGWPAFWPGDPPFVTESSGLIEVTAERAHVRVCQIAIDPTAFVRVSRVACILKATQGDEEDRELAAVDLVAGREEVALVIPDPEGSAAPKLSCLAFPPDGQPGNPLTLITDVACPEFLQVPAHQLEVLEPDAIRVRLSTPAKSGVLFVAMAFRSASEPETSEGQIRSFTLTEEEPTVIWRTWRGSVFESLQYFHRVQFVPIDSIGRALPMEFGEWLPESKADFVIELPGLN